MGYENCATKKKSVQVAKNEIKETLQRKQIVVYNTYIVLDLLPGLRYVAPLFVMA